MVAPRRFKTAFIFFSSTRHKEIKVELAAEGKTEKTTTIAKMVSKEWRAMLAEEREFWEDKSRGDKARYEAEMAVYNEARKTSKRSKKDPDAPKRPMSAFLAFSNKRRAPLKREHPNATNADLSKMLSKVWKAAEPDFKATYIEEEAKLRAQYKINIVAWRKKKSEEMKQAMANNAMQQQQQQQQAAQNEANATEGQQGRSQQQQPDSSLMAQFGAAGGYMPQMGGGQFAGLARDPRSGLGAADLLGSFQGRQGDPASFYGGGFSADQLINQQFMQFSQQDPSRLAGLGQSQLQGQLLAAQGLQFGAQGLTPSLQALVGNNPFAGGNVGFPGGQGDNGLQAQWLQNASYGGGGFGGGPGGGQDDSNRSGGFAPRKNEGD